MSCSARREAQLSAQGWVKQFMADEPRLSEAVEEYRALGFEVHLEPVDPVACGQEGGCTACFSEPEAAARLKIIFTRSGASGGQPPA
ncbi:MAG: hypothetical protein K9K66_02480 [Desulfarculaceae bacterium]|nr:hypothetical protein [Desulfarculaceae bacterium]MCF8070915.1 hypothetical protein [Desulfarculaceae bacterium]MCF8100503.1 hypothetical protein [Desulfarculaceae bacterium]MCF8116529.1 hypothetical protein [Desulfarculaceae bacterium]